MKKICIFTIYDDNNFGNRLQNYAMQSILNKKYNVVTLKHRAKTDVKKNFLYLSIVSVLKGIQDFFRHKGNYKRYKKFKKFDKNIKFTKRYKTYSYIKKLDKFYDYIVIGSDQIWNPNIFKDAIENYFLPTIECDKKIAVSPSVGVDNLNEEQTSIFVKGLKSFNFLSCREDEGSQIITKLSGKNCVTTIDPTLLLSSEDWMKLCEKPNFISENEKYILVYFLGKLPDNYVKIIDTISQKYKLKLVNISFPESEYYNIGPSEFLYLINNCSIMLTDSFHGCIFSYIFEKPFRIFERVDETVSMNSRLKNLIRKLELGDVYITQSSDLNSLLKVSYNKTILEREKSKFNDYIIKFMK